VTIEALHDAIRTLLKGAERIRRAVEFEKALLNTGDKKII
jgi:hypothetical protein